MTKTKSKAASGVATRQRLLEAAELLFSEQGFDAVSVRDITEKAGANVAAVNYHFNSREHLVELVMERYINPINDERLARLEALEKRSGSKSLALEEVLDAFVRPFVTQVRRSELSENMFYKLMGRCLGDRGGMMPKSVEQGFQLMLIRFKKAFKKALPGVGEEELLWRVHFMVGSMIHSMAHGDTLNRFTQGASGNPSMETTLSRFIRFGAAGMRQEIAPAESPMKKGSSPADGESQSAEAEARSKGPQEEFLF
ncbi:TetR/AcrR family transcriptional regulator [Haloferula chungangensis]|uniref:TetR/AcrR family transcriptional regulator n=1 Tax=Haloferula chungangensis TaxID=1048331 RepID=A0ABW2L5V1_9BACT